MPFPKTFAVGWRACGRCDYYDCPPRVAAVVVAVIELAVVVVVADDDDVAGGELCYC